MRAKICIMRAKNRISIMSFCFVFAPGRIVLGHIAWITLHRTARACIASSTPHRRCVTSPHRMPAGRTHSEGSFRCMLRCSVLCSALLFECFSVCLPFSLLLSPPLVSRPLHSLRRVLLSFLFFSPSERRNSQRGPNAMVFNNSCECSDKKNEPTSIAFREFPTDV